MKVVLDSLPPDGVTVSAGIPDAWCFEAARQSLEAKPRELSAVLRVQKAESNRFRVEGNLSVSWRSACDRCVRMLANTLSGPVDLTYQRGELPSEDELDLTAEDMDIGWVDGGSLDLSDVVSEQVTLWLPDRLVCASECSSREDSTDTGPCEVPEHDGGPDLQKKSPFSALANWKPSH
jgi:uncharacterized metal-binding protein YceD (DUF177 family)